MPKVDEEKWNAFQQSFRKATGADAPAPQPTANPPDDRSFSDIVSGLFKNEQNKKLIGQK